MPKVYQSKSIRAEQARLTAAEQARRDDLKILVRRYEAVRLMRGLDRDAAERNLGLALAQHDGLFQHEGWIWQWSRTEQAIMRHKALTLHQVLSHRR